MSLCLVTVVAAAVLSAGIALEALALVVVAACGLVVLSGLNGMRIIRAVERVLRD